MRVTTFVGWLVERHAIAILIIVLALTVKLFLDLVLTPSDLVSLAPAKGGGH